ncbi:YidB family protein, partial [Caulobacter sp. 17J65-9]|uniref:YidB family protein n=1 Tax=Caulobacter sp. 17J65-9 TaxID=2709382 RepID=UPI0013CB37C0
ADTHETGGGLPGGLGGVLAGLGGAGALGALVEQFGKNGHGGLIDSWIGRGQNQQIAPHQLAEALGPHTVDELEVETGLGREQLLSELSDELPDAVDKLTPEGRLPNDHEIGRMLS